MVVLTLHRDTPLSTEEIRLLPPGCYPVLGAGDTVARANLSLPIAHIARYAAELARTIPDADFVAEERPTVRGGRLLEAGVLDEPYWAYTPPLSFRTEPPGAATLAEGPGTVDPRSPLAGAEEEAPPEPPQTLPDTPQTIDFASLVAIAKNAGRINASVDPGVADERKLDLSAMFAQAAPEPPVVPEAVPSPPGGAQVPSQIMDMFRSIRSQEAHEGVPVLKVDGHQNPTAPAAPPKPVPVGVEHTVRRPMSLSDLVARMQASAAPEPEPAASAPQPPEPGPESSVSAPEISAFWERVQAGDVEGAEATVRADGLAQADHGHLASLFAAEEPELVALGLRVSRATAWPEAARLSRRLLYHTAPAVRVEVARTLAALSGLDAEADLVVLSRDMDRTVSNAASTALRRLKKRSRF